MIDCLDKHQHQLQLINGAINHQQQQQQSLNHHQPPPPPNQNPPPPYLPPNNRTTNPVNPPVSVYPQHYPQQPLHTQQQQQQHIQQLQSHPSQRIDVAHHQQSGNDLIGYYFGSISRDTAEWILKTHGKSMDGAYLLRSSGPNDDFVLSLMVNHGPQTTNLVPLGNLEVLHYKIVETEDSFVALHGQVGDEKFATIDELIDKAQGVATKPRWPIRRQSLESQILPPTYWGLTVDQIRLAILIKAKQWGFPLISSLLQHQDQMQQLTTFNAVAKAHQGTNPTIDETQVATDTNVTTLNNETIRTLIYKSLHEFQPWFHGKISREEAERRIEEGTPRDGRFLVRERDNYSYAMCISHKKTTKHYRIDVLPTGELAIQDGRKFTSLMALVSHYTIMSDGLWCALTESCPRPINGSNIGCCDKTPISGLTPGFNDGASASNSQIRVPPSNGVYYNNSPATVNQQGLYCIPPVSSNSNNINSNNNANNNVLNLMIPGPISNISLENSQTNLHEYHPNVPANTNQTAEQVLSNSNAIPKIQSGLICSPQSGVVSLKAPIREWLQTINHKWSQLMASKNQHQSLNSFLFGNQNPLNNHCRYNRRDRGHPMNYRHRKCKNGHTSCACIRQQMLNNRAPTTGSAQAHMNGFNTINRNGQHFCKSNDIDHANQVAAISRYPEGVQGKMHDCCPSGANLFRAAVKSHQTSTGSVMPNSFINQNHPTFVENQQPNNLNMTTTLLSRLPLNSGFTLSSQSFIGSPLFAVKQAQSEKKSLAGIGSQASSSSGSGNGRTVEEEKLISPVQSISGNLKNNPYNFDIYGSQTSTALVNDQIPTSNSSTSSSGTIRLIQRALNSSNNQPTHVPYGSHHTAKVINQNDRVMASACLAAQPSSIHAGPILCGQHAGPAFRYTNCNDENNYKPCYHRPQVKCRAADDSQLATSSTESACPSAMAKFVQFQDGQCLRTHRDTRSIQMAYLSSRPNNNGFSQPFRDSSQVPLRELNVHHPNDIQSFPSTNNSTNWNGDQCGSSGCTGAGLHNANASGLMKQDGGFHLSRPRQESRLNRQNVPAQENSAKFYGNEIDLMDCGADSTFDFKYDPKLIKSSSIETLCGFGGNEEENFDDMVNCKSNTELIISLQSCWMASQPQLQSSKILSPIQTTTGRNATPDLQAMDNLGDLEHDVDGPDGGSILTSLSVDTKQNEQLDHMKKKHDLDELTTNLLSELTASLRAQVDLKNKRSGFNNNLPNMENQSQHDSLKRQNQASGGARASVEVNPLELINEFDTLIPNNNNIR